MQSGEALLIVSAVNLDVLFVMFFQSTSARAASHSPLKARKTSFVFCLTMRAPSFSLSSS